MAERLADACRRADRNKAKQAEEPGNVQKTVWEFSSRERALIDQLGKGEK
jgi:hypothetical protein